MAIALDATSASAWTDASPLTWNHTVGTGDDRFLVVGISTAGGSSASPTSVTFDGVSMTKVREDPFGTTLASSVWVLENPNSGTKVISVAFNDTLQNCFGGAISYTGVNQSTTVDSATGTNGTATGAIAFNVTTVADNCWVFGHVATEAVSGLVVNTPTLTSRWTTNHLSTTATNGQDNNAPKTPAGAVSVGWTLAGTTVDYAMSGISFRPSGISKGTVAGGRSSGGDITTSIPISASQNCIVAIATSQDSNTANIGLSGIARNGENFIKATGFGGSGGSGQPCYAEAWYLANPTVGTYDAVADFVGGINECTVTYYPLSDVDTSNVINGFDGDTANGSSPDMTITTTRDGCFLIAGLVAEQAITSIDAPADSDATYTDQSFENTSVGSLAGGSAGLKTMDFLMSATGAYAQVMVAVNPIGEDIGYKSFRVNVNGGVNIRPRAFGPGIAR